MYRPHLPICRSKVIKPGTAQLTLCATVGSLTINDLKSSKFFCVLVKIREILSFDSVNLFNWDVWVSLNGLDSCLNSERESVPDEVPELLLSSNFGLTYILGSLETLNDCCLFTEGLLSDMFT